MRSLPGNRMRAIRAALPVALTALALAPAGAGAVTFGANLSVAPNVDFDCTLTPPVGGFQLPTGQQSCTWWTTGRLTDTSEGHVVPYGGGTITRARVRVGPVTGPMQFVVMRSLRHPLSLADPACCFPVGASEVFTPAPNGVTEVPMSVPVRHDTDKATGINNYDHIAISVLASGVPIPAYFTGDQSIGAPTGGGFYPHYTPGTERTTGMFGVVGFQTLINADLEPTASATPTVPTATGTPTVPTSGTPTGPTDVSGTNPIALGGTLGRVRGRNAIVPLTCRSPEECAGVLRLQSRAAGAATVLNGTGRRAATYGQARFEIASGQTESINVRLTRAGRRLLRNRRRTRVFVNVSVGSRPALSTRIVLRR